MSDVARAAFGGVLFVTAWSALIGGVVILFLGPTYLVLEFTGAGFAAVMGSLLAGCALACAYIAAFAELLNPQ